MTAVVIATLTTATATHVLTEVAGGFYLETSVEGEVVGGRELCRESAMVWCETCARCGGDVYGRGT